MGYEKQNYPSHNPIPDNSKLSPGYAYRAKALRPNLSPGSWEVLEHVAMLQTREGIVHVSPDAALAPLWPKEQRSKEPLNFEDYAVGFEWYMLADEGGTVVVTRTQDGFSYQYANKEDRLSELKAILGLSVPIDDPRVTETNNRFMTEYPELYKEMKSYGWILAKVRPNTVDIVKEGIRPPQDDGGEKLLQFIKKLWEALKVTFPNNKISFLDLSVGHGTHGTNIGGGHSLSHEFQALAQRQR